MEKSGSLATCRPFIIQGDTKGGIDMEEIWRDIEGFEGLYQVSNIGNVRSFHKNSNGVKKVATLKMKNGYLTVHLSKCGKAKRIGVHRLVAIAFLEREEGKTQVNHKNENKEDNRIENLEWCSQRYNNTYGTRIERVSKTCLKNKKRSIPIEQRSLDGDLIRVWDGGGKDIQRQTGFNQALIWRCCNNRNKTAYGYIWRYAS